MHSRYLVRKIQKQKSLEGENKTESLILEGTVVCYMQ